MQPTQETLDKYGDVLYDENTGMPLVEGPVNEVQAWLDSQVSDAVIRVGQAAGGNRTADEIAHGIFGGTPPLAQSTRNPAAMNAQPYPTNINLPILGAVSVLQLATFGLAIYLGFFHKKGHR